MPLDIHLLRNHRAKIDGDEVGYAPSTHTHDPLTAWPVGSVYVAAVATSPTTLLGGGTWASLGSGRLLGGKDAVDCYLWKRVA